MSFELLASTLKQSFDTRVLAFSNYLDSLIVRNADASAEFLGALRMIKVYAECLPQQIDAEFERSPTEEERFHLVNALMDDLRDKIEETDLRFARSGQNDVPRSLRSLLRQEFERLGIPSSVSPVLSIGVPGTFDTRIEDLESYLFHDVIDLIPYQDQPGFEEGDFSLISLPHFEGTQALWNPIVVGHEAAHLAIFRLDQRNIPGNRTRPFLSEVHRSLTGSQTTVDWRLSWIEEILCDLSAVKRYGPAAFTSMCEMLSAFNREDEELTHPPRSLRVKIMMTALESLSGAVGARGWWSPVVDPWEIFSVFAADPRRGLDAPGVQAFRKEQDRFAELLTSRTTFLMDTELHTSIISGYPYPFAARRRTVEGILERFLMKRTSGSYVDFLDDDDSKVHSPIEEADVVNAAWLGRPQPLSAKDYERLIRLAGKSVDTLEFVRLAEKSELHLQDYQLSALRETMEERPADHDVQDVLSGGSGIPTAGILSGTEIFNRAFVDQDLVLDPLFERAIGDAGIDIRLGPEFIVFRRTGTSVYDPLSDSIDYAALREIVLKDWGDQFVLHPNELVLASTLEYIVLPSDLTADITSRSSYGRLGLLTVTAAQVQPRSTGCITLELINQGMTPIALSPGLRLAQLRLHRVEPSSEPIATSRKYECAVGPEFPKVNEDWDKWKLATLRRHARNEISD